MRQRVYVWLKGTFVVGWGFAYYDKNDFQQPRDYPEMPKKKLTQRFIKSLNAPDKRTTYYDTNEKGLILRVTTAGTKTFSYRYHKDGKNQRFTIGQYPDFSLAEARAEVQRLRVSIRSGKDPQFERQKKKNPTTFKELVTDYKKKHVPTLREKTQTEYLRILDNELLPDFGNLGIQDVTRGRILLSLNDKAHKEGSPTMANRIRAVLSSVLSFAINNGLADTNPVSKINTFTDGTNKRDRYYSNEEIKELWAAFSELNQPIDSYLKILLITAQRKTETMKMRWDDIKGDGWTIPASLAKNKQEHYVPLPKLALTIINNLKPYSGNSDFVFLSPRIENQPISSIRTPAQHIQDTTSITDFRVHDLRRTAATNMAKLKVGRTVLGKILNHKGAASDNLVTAIYDRHSYEDEKRQALLKWEMHLKRILTGSSSLMDIFHS